MDTIPTIQSAACFLAGIGLTVPAMLMWARRHYRDNRRKLPELRRRSVADSILPPLR